MNEWPSPVGSPKKPLDPRERLFDIIKKSSKYNEPMQSRLGKKEASFLASVALAGCIDEEGVLLKDVSVKKRGTQSPKHMQTTTVDHSHFDLDLLEFNEDNAHIKEAIHPNKRSLTGKRGSNCNSIDSKARNSMSDEGLYTDDLAFLNKFNQEKVLNMSSSFKNPGRGWIQKQKQIQHQGKWGVVVGTYNPKTNLVQRRASIHTAFKKPHNNTQKA